MREIRLYGSEGGGAVRSPYPYQPGFRLALRLAGMTGVLLALRASQLGLMTCSREYSPILTKGLLDSFQDLYSPFVGYIASVEHRGRLE